MGCELCCSENREIREINIMNMDNDDGHFPIQNYGKFDINNIDNNNYNYYQLNDNDNINSIVSDNMMDKESVYTSNFDRLNEKYSIPLNKLKRLQGEEKESNIKSLLNNTNKNNDDIKFSNNKISNNNFDKYNTKISTIQNSETKENLINKFEECDSKKEKKKKKDNIDKKDNNKNDYTRNKQNNDFEKLYSNKVDNLEDLYSYKEEKKEKSKKKEKKHKKHKKSNNDDNDNKENVHNNSNSNKENNDKNENIIYFNDSANNDDKINKKETNNKNENENIKYLDRVDSFGNPGNLDNLDNDKKNRSKNSNYNDYNDQNNEINDNKNNDDENNDNKITDNINIDKEKNKKNKVDKYNNINDTDSSNKKKKNKNKHRHKTKSQETTHNKKLSQESDNNEENSNIKSSFNNDRNSSIYSNINNQSKNSSSSKSKTPSKNNNKLELINTDVEKQSTKNLNLYHPGENSNELLNSIDKDLIEKILDDAPLRTETPLEKMKNYFIKNSQKLSPVEKSWLIFRFVTENISYDFKALKEGHPDCSVEGTYKNGKSVCSGYANLYKYFLENLDVEVSKVAGYSKGFSYKLGKTITETETHEWNVVYIDNGWYFVEPTWGSGYTEGDNKFIKNFNDYYFFTPPNEYVRGHLPFDEKWQMIDKKVDQDEFLKNAPLKSHFFKFGFYKIEPDNTFNKVKQQGSVKIFFDSNNRFNTEFKNISINSKLYNNKNNNNVVENSTMTVRKKNYFEIFYTCPKKNEYKLTIYGKFTISKEYNELVSLIMINEEKSSKPITFPKTTALYNNADIQLIEPINGFLNEGETMTFTVINKTYPKLFIIMKTGDSNGLIEMEKINDDTFMEEDVFICGKGVSISKPGQEENTYETIIEFEVIPSKKKITLPKVFAGPKNKLLSPICDSLKKGKEYEFKIKCNGTDQIGVSEGSDLIYLEKNGEEFHGKKKIVGNEGVVNIVFKKPNQGFGVIYQYKVV